ncbi:alpha/beta hydrolase [Nonomuraea longicatena]
MMRFSAPDGTELAYYPPSGGGEPVVCLPGGPMQASGYLGDLAGLPGMLRLDLRGTGGSAVPEDPASYGCARQVADVEALRLHLGLADLTLLGHSAGANLAVMYAARHPGRVRRLVLVAPSLFALGVPVTAEMRLATGRKRAEEPWYGPAMAALEAATSGRGTPADFEALAPFAHRYWDEAARAWEAAWGRNEEAARLFGNGFEPERTREQVAKLAAPVLVVAGGLDLNSPVQAVTELTGLFPHAELKVLAEAAHFPWRDDPEGFAAALGRR